MKKVNANGSDLLILKRTVNFARHIGNCEDIDESDLLEMKARALRARDRIEEAIEQYDQVIGWLDKVEDNGVLHLKQLMPMLKEDE